MSEFYIGKSNRDKYFLKNILYFAQLAGWPSVKRRTGYASFRFQEGALNILNFFQIFPVYKCEACLPAFKFKS